MARFCQLLILVTLSGVGWTSTIDNRIKQFDNENGQKTVSHWAVLVAGSNGYYNYRHQADACHAYQILRKNGFQEDHIITFMYDDIASSPENPTPGIIINHPNGSDVYHGVKIDYKKEDVKSENFLNVITGNKAAMEGIGTGRVLESGPNDHVFINFADHGAPGLIAFPSDVLHARDLMSSLEKMYETKMYKQLVFYLEACESGSMFYNLLNKSMNIYATTAANPEESSYACYFDNTRKTYLGDVYSVKWMEDSDKEDLSAETLHKQFEITKEETNTSHVQQYGNIKMSDESVSEFQGGQGYRPAPPVVLPTPPYDAVASEDVPMAILKNRLLLAKTKDEELTIIKQIQELTQLQQKIDSTMKHIAGVASRDHQQLTSVMHSRHSLGAYECYESVTKQFDRECFRLSRFDFALRRLYILANLCEEMVPTATINEAIYKVCQWNKK